MSESIAIGVVEAPERGIEHVAGQEGDMSAVQRLRRALAGEVDKLGRQVDRHHLGAAPRRIDGERTGAAAGIEHAGATQILRQVREDLRTHRVTTGAHGGADLRDRRIRRQPRPRLDRGAVEVGEELAPAIEVGRRVHGIVLAQSKPRRSNMSRSFIGFGVSGSVPL